MILFFSMGKENLPGVDVVVTQDDILLSPGANEKGILLSPTDDPEKAKAVEEREQWKDPVQVRHYSRCYLSVIS